MLGIALVTLLAASCHGNSLGIGIPCDISLDTVGTDLEVPVKPDPVTPMWWVHRGNWAGNKYTLKTTDDENPGPTSYKPGEWTEIYIRANDENEQLTGLLMYAEDSSGEKVGEWLPERSGDFQVSDERCVTHRNADPKHYLNVFRFRADAGTGDVTIKALVKYGLAFPVLTGVFYWPNDEHLVLSEMRGGNSNQLWYEAEVGQSCDEVCRTMGKGCDMNTMRSVGSNATELYEVAKLFTSCSPPMIPGCSGISPTVGDVGCFYHDDVCPDIEYDDLWVQEDPCASVSACVAGQVYDAACCSEGGFHWCSKYYIQAPPYEQDFGPWEKVGECAPEGGFVAPTVPPADRPTRAATSCSAKSDDTDEGRRLCACAGTPSASPSVVAGLVCGFLMLLALIGAGVFIYWRIRSQHNEKKEPSAKTSSSLNMLANESSPFQAATTSTESFTPLKPKPPKSAGGLPAGWTKEYDPEQKAFYFFNADTGASQWTAPN